MQPEYAPTLAAGLPAAPAVSAHLRKRLDDFLASLLVQLDARLDRRLVRTFHATLEVFLLFRHRAHGLLLSELGAYLLGPHHAPAGTKRLSNLLRSSRWSSELIARFLWDQATTRVQQLCAAGEEAILLWDESVLEKPESLAAEGLCAVRSRKAARLKRIKPGFYTPPGGPPVFVPGLHWLALLVIGVSGPPQVAVMRWWSKRGSERLTAEDAPAVRQAVLEQCLAAWGRQVLHVWDRGFAGSPWLGRLLAARVRFVLRWPKRYQLRDSMGVRRPAWQMTRGLQAWDERYLRDAHRRQVRKVSVLAVCLNHPDYAAPLWLVVSRHGRGREPWYLLTNEPIATEEDAWRVVLAYARRWQIEMAFRYGKSELAMESPRLWTWEGRRKLLLMVTLAYAFLLSLLDERLELLRAWLLRWFCHRTGVRGRETPTPLYRLRSAISRLWLAYPAPLWPLPQNSG
jgi:Transposase DDE domain